MPKQRKTKPVSAASVFLKAAQADFRKRAEQSARQGFTGAWPEIHEFGFAKKPRQNPVDAVRTAKGLPRRGRLFVDMRKLRSGEKFHIHTHPKQPEPSIGDFYELVKEINRQGKITGVIVVFNEQPAVHSFFFWNTLYLEIFRPKLAQEMVGAKKAQSIKNAVREAAELITASGRVFIRPTRTLFNMRGKKRRELVAYLTKQAKQEKQLVYAKADGRITFPVAERKIRELQRQTTVHISQNYGEIFKLRYVPMPGYKYDKNKKEFVPR